MTALHSIIFGSNIEIMVWPSVSPKCGKHLIVASLTMQLWCINFENLQIFLVQKQISYIFLNEQNFSKKLFLVVVYLFEKSVFPTSWHPGFLKMLQSYKRFLKVLETKTVENFSYFVSTRELSIYQESHGFFAYFVREIEKYWYWSRGSGYVWDIFS